MSDSTRSLWNNFLLNDASSNQTSPLSHQAQLQALSNNYIVVDLSDRSLIKLSGTDAFNFLQGQVTNDANLLTGGKSQFSGYCNPKGRLLALFFAFAISEEIYLSFNQKLLEPILKRLKMYVLRSKVQITEASDLVQMGVAGFASENKLISLFSNIPQNAHEVVQHSDVTLMRLPSATPMFVIISHLEKATEIWLKLANVETVATCAAWGWLEIQAGIPEISPETQEDFVPQMLNLDALGGINYKKGCYTGQEIVARTHYLGKVKRRTQLAHIDSTTSPQAGDVIKNSANQEVGEIVRVSPALNSGFDVLVECRLESLAEGSIFWNEHALTIKPLPYLID